MKDRDFKVNGKRYSMIATGAELMKWQAIVFDTSYNAWTKTCYYGRTQQELKEIVKNGNNLINTIEC